MLVVPSTSVKYDADKERREENEAKQKHLQRIEDARSFRVGEDKGFYTLKNFTLLKTLFSFSLNDLRINCFRSVLSGTKSKTS